MDAGIGARIGVVVGVILVGCLAVAMAAGGLVARYLLHNMAGFDAQLTQQLHLQIEHALATNPDAKSIRGLSLLAGVSGRNDAGRIRHGFRNSAGAFDRGRRCGRLSADASPGFGVMGGFRTERTGFNGPEAAGIIKRNRYE